MTNLALRLPITVVAFAIAVLPASAAAISWTSWTSGTVSATAGSAAGSISGLGVGVTYTGEMSGLAGAATVQWSPAGSFTGGTVDNGPPTVANSSIILIGGGMVVNTITFSTPVVNPIMAIWSLGRPQSTAQFLFTASEPFTIQGGGPNAQFGGASIFAGGACPANTICGAEGNGVVQFNGTFSQLTWTNPIGENFYAFTVGATGLSDIPEPASLLLFGAGLLGIGVLRWRQSGKSV